MGCNASTTLHLSDTDHHIRLSWLIVTDLANSLLEPLPRHRSRPAPCSSRHTHEDEAPQLPPGHDGHRPSLQKPVAPSGLCPSLPLSAIRHIPGRGSDGRRASNRSIVTITPLEASAVKPATTAVPVSVFFCLRDISREANADG